MNPAPHMITVLGVCGGAGTSTVARLLQEAQSAGQQAPSGTGTTESVPRPSVVVDGGRATVQSVVTAQTNGSVVIVVPISARGRACLEALQDLLPLHLTNTKIVFVRVSRPPMIDRQPPVTPLHTVIPWDRAITDRTLPFSAHPHVQPAVWVPIHALWQQLSSVESGP